MNDKHFKTLSKEYHRGLSDKRIAFLKKLGKVIDEFEMDTYSVVRVNVIFDVLGQQPLP